MKATGIVRRIDDLGRVVIPKEIRRTMRIREGDPLEIYTDREGEVIFKKYSPMGELALFSEHYAEAIYKSENIAVAICDRSEITACAGVSKRDYLGKAVSEGLDDLMNTRAIYIRKQTDLPCPLTDYAGGWHVTCFAPILVEGDVVGGVVALSQLDETASDKIVSVIRTSATFLSRVVEN